MAVRKAGDQIESPGSIERQIGATRIVAVNWLPGVPPLREKRAPGPSSMDEATWGARP